MRKNGENRDAESKPLIKDLNNIAVQNSFKLRREANIIKGMYAKPYLINGGCGKRASMVEKYNDRAIIKLSFLESNRIIIVFLFKNSF